MEEKYVTHLNALIDIDKRDGDTDRSEIIFTFILTGEIP